MKYRLLASGLNRRQKRLVTLGRLRERDAASLSDRAIARELGVSQPFVSRLRREADQYEVADASTSAHDDQQQTSIAAGSATNEDVVKPDGPGQVSADQWRREPGIRVESPPRAGNGSVVRVCATKRGFYGNTFYRPGDVFTLTREADFSPRWMARVPAEVREQRTSAQAAIGLRRARETRASGGMIPSAAPPG